MKKAWVMSNHRVFSSKHLRNVIQIYTYFLCSLIFIRLHGTLQVFLYREILPSIFYCCVNNHTFHIPERKRLLNKVQCFSCQKSCMPKWPSNTEDSTYLSAFLSNTLSLYYKFPFTKIITWLICTSMTTHTRSNLRKDPRRESIWEKIFKLHNL